MQLHMHSARAHTHELGAANATQPALECARCYAMRVRVPSGSRDTTHSRSQCESHSHPCWLFSESVCCYRRRRTVPFRLHRGAERASRPLSELGLAVPPNRSALDEYKWTEQLTPCRARARIRTVAPAKRELMSLTDIHGDRARKGTRIRKC